MRAKRVKSKTNRLTISENISVRENCIQWYLGPRCEFIPELLKSAEQARNEETFFCQNATGTGFDGSEADDYRDMTV